MLKPLTQDQIDRISFETPQLSREQVIYWLEKFRGGDVTDPAFQWKVIENFVNAVYLYDDRIRIVYNYTKQGAETVDLAFVEGLPEPFGEGFGVGASCSTITHLSELGDEATIIVTPAVFVLTVPLPACV